jgi:hypothetical protein
MALKRPRKIEVNEITYHWKSSNHGGLHVVILDPNQHNQKMVIHFDNHLTVVTPRVVKGYIISALKQGWKCNIEYDVNVSETWKKTK